jgi:hypothetical protein
VTNKIVKKIVNYQVVTPDKANKDGANPASETPAGKIVQMHEKVMRPEVLMGSTYKIKTPLTEHAIYMTIYDIMLNEGTEHELRRPYEVFINSKNMDHFQWIVALTRIISAVFRKGGDITFLTEELNSVFDPKGGYFKKGGRYMPSLVAEIGDAIDQHLKMLGLIAHDNLDEHQKKFIAAKKAQLTSNHATDESDYPPEATLCSKCQTKAVVIQSGCATCLCCGDAKC